jgi:nucleotide-binding universal stress UspA family protein
MNPSSFRRILCAIDLSPFAPHVLRHAAALARWADAPLAVLHVIRPADFRLRDVFPLDAAARERRLEAVHRMVRSALGPAGVRVVLRQGDAAQEVAAEAAAWEANVVVVGTHARRGLEHWEMGSVAEDVIRRAPCPVLAVPVGSRPAVAEGPPFQSLLCALDLGPSSAGTLQTALSLAIRGRATTAVVHALDDLPEDARRMQLRLGAPWVAAYRQAAVRQATARLRDLLPEEVRAACDVQEFLLPGRAARRIVRLARERGTDLIVMGAHGAKPLGVTLFGSTAARVLRESPCPVLTVPPRARAAQTRSRLALLPIAR